MISIYQQVLGTDYEKLHPEIQKRFSLNSDKGLGAVGTGVMERVWSYQANPRTHFHSGHISGQERLPNRNTLICEGAWGHLLVRTEHGSPP